MRKIKLIVKESNKNLRIDVFINKKEKNISRTRIKKLILDNKLKINEKIVRDPSKKVSAGDIVYLAITILKNHLLNPSNLS